MNRGAFLIGILCLATVISIVSSAYQREGDPVWEQHLGKDLSQRYTNEWIAKVDGGEAAAAEVASNLGYRLIGEVRGFPGIYRMLKDDFPKVGKRGEPHLTQRLVMDDRVMWAEQQFAKEREKRDFPQLPLPDTNYPWLPRSHGPRSDPKPESNNVFNDELWDHQWYLQDMRTREDIPKVDLHVVGVYKKGISGRGVRICVLDDGIEFTHPDLRDNYDPEISMDINDEDDDPSPRYDPMNSNSHGTRCAGEIAMAANNGICGVGVAFNARIGGVRLLDGLVSDLTEGLSLGWAQDKVDIYSASWGPKDDGKTVEGPGRLALQALLDGVTNGRKGKGIVFVWASGNGGSKGDDCSCDGYAASPYTLSVSSASQRGQFPWYGERCPSTLATTYSSGEYRDQMIATTDLHGKCTIKHTGTSAAAPLAAGIIALALEVNPSLTWRDIQHLVVWTSQPSPLAHNVGWKKNGAGFLVNPSFGFGLMDALALVTAAENWFEVPPQHLCLVQADGSENVTLTSRTPVELTFHSTGCRKSSTESHYDSTYDENAKEEGDEVNFLEHIELEASIRYSVRGALQIYLTSPSGTTAQLLKVRPADDSENGFQHWRFMSVLTWGENPVGIWKLRIEDPTGSTTNHGMVGSSTVLLLRGTRELPSHMKNGLREYDEDYNRVHKKTEQTQERSLQSTKSHHSLGNGNREHQRLMVSPEESRNGFYKPYRLLDKILSIMSQTEEDSN